ncbi:MAG: Maf family protein [Firmicutes bacterium]|nr:Maf family protein [Bacillota bacterium]MDH7494974.1 Maf family protein [Bacillota bacterium]
MRLVLASASPARAELLRQIGLRFDVVPSGIVEDTVGGDDLGESVAALALRKARHVSHTEHDALVIGADTVVVLDGEILGKPADADDARNMLRQMSGRWHQVASGLAVVDSRSGLEASCYEITQVLMADLSEEDIEGYVATGEPLGKAGSYAIQGRGALLVERISGCYFNVVGLPLARLVTLADTIGVDLMRTVFRG